MNKQLIAIILLVIGAGLIIWGLQLSDSVESKLTKAISGSDTDKVMFMYIGGAVAIAAGAFMFFKK